MIIIDMIFNLLFIGLSVYVARLWHIENKLKKEEIKALNKTFDKLEELDKEIKVDNIIKRLEEEMYVDEKGNNVLQGGTIDYEQKYKYEIGCNYGLTKAIKIVKAGVIDE